MKPKAQELWEGHDQRITRGLIIDQPWIGKILRGEKLWEMRSTHTSIRGPIGLIEKGSGTLVGVARLVDSKGPLSFDEIFDNEASHRVGPEVYSRPDYKWNHAWILSGVFAFSQPVPYKHKSGAVIWVELDGDARKGMDLELAPTQKPCAMERNGGLVRQQEEDSFKVHLRVPVARDGSHFCEERCQRGGYYTVGEKGDEQRFSNYRSALAYLKNMPVAKWRRPNEAGNWGIVSAARWKQL